MDFSWISIEVLLFAVAVIAGFVDTLAGGGGLITMPALLLTGMSPLAALGTNKLQGSVGTATSTYMMLATKKIKFSNVKFLMLWSFIGSVIGAIIIQFMDVDSLNYIIPIVLIVIAVYFIFSPKSHEVAHHPKISKAKFRYILVPSIGCYDGMFGPGTGSFFSTAGAALRGKGFVDATAQAKALNFSSNIASLIIFLSAGQVIWLVGLSMMAGQMLGAWLGSHCLIKINPAYLRIIVVVMCIAMIIQYGMKG